MGAEATAIQAVESICGSLSLIACIGMLIKISNQKSANFTSPLLLALFSFILVLSLMLIVGRAGLSNAGFCGFQGFMIEWMYMCIMLWDMLMSYLMYTWIVKRQHPKRMDKILHKNLIAVVVVALVVTIIVAGTDSIAEAYIWCWIGQRNWLARLFGFELFLIIAWFSNCAMLWSVRSSLQSRMKRATFHEKITALLESGKDGSIQTKLIVYLVIFTIVWFFVLLNRLAETLSNDTFFPTALLQSIFVSLQGFLYAFVYSGLVKCVFCRPRHYQKPVKVFLKDSALSDADYREEMVDPTPQNMALVTKAAKQFTPKKYSIFSTTFNMGEAPLSKMEQNVKDWILPGHDVYAIGVQECMDLASVRVAIQRHLGGPEKYQMYGIAIGSDTKSLGFHGFIALTVLVKTSELMEGNIQVTVPAKGAMATGADLIVTTAQNKGAVGIPLQIHDTSIGFVTCHLPSDSKGKSKLTKRNASAHAILKEVTLAPEDLGFDLHLQHDHVLVFGDLNYRMDTDGDGGGVNSLTGVTVACGVEKQGYGDDPNWITRKFNLLRHNSDPLFPTIQEIKLIHTSKSQAHGAWKSVLRADELRSIMDDGDAFFGFEEPMPAFPPSYKRRKYGDADCGDYTSFDTVIKGYSNTGYVENLLSVGSVRQKKSASMKLMKGINKHFRGSSNKRNQSSTTGESALTASALAEMGRNSLTEKPRPSEDEDSDGGGSSGKQTDGPATAAASDARSVRSNSTVNLEDYEEDFVPEKEDPSKLRPPSYTDRVLVHSLPDRRDRVTVQAYDSCDLVRVSDHRPVAMTLLLEVNSNVFYKESAQSDAHANVHEHSHAKEPQFELYELLISDFSVTLVDLLYVEDEDDDEEDGAAAGTGDAATTSSDEAIAGENPITGSAAWTGRPSDAASSSSSVSTSVAARFGGENAAVNPLHHPRSGLSRPGSTAMRSNLPFARITEDDEAATSTRAADTTTADEDGAVSQSSAVGAPAAEAAPSERGSILKKTRSGRIRFSDIDEAADSSATTATPTGAEDGGAAAGVESPPSLSPPSLSPFSSPDRKKKKGGIKFVEADSTTLGTTSLSATRESRGAESESTAASGHRTGDDIEMATLSSASSSAKEDGDGGDVVEVLTPPRPAPAPRMSILGASFSRSDLMKKSRSRSIFGSLRQGGGGRRKSLFQTFFGGGDDENAEEDGEIRKTESEDEIIKNMADQSMNWKGEASGDWRRRVIEEERERRRREKEAQPHNKLIKVVKKKKKKMNQHRIDQVTVVFPLPSKDPLLSYRRMYDFAKAFDMNESGPEQAQFDEENQMYVWTGVCVQSATDVKEAC